METNALDKDEQLQQLLLEKVGSQENVKKLIFDYANSFREMMAYYRCAMMEVTTKFNVLSEELSLEYDHNPIESIKTRLKAPESILEKLQRKGLPMSLKSVEENLYDVAGVRVICGFPSDIYMLADAFLKQDDVILLQRKDYIQNPKPNGYRSLHLVVKTPIFLHNQKKMMNVEVQFRTISMDWWATLEHKIRYKKDIESSPLIDSELYACAEISARLDKRMEEIHRRVAKRNEKNENEK